MTREAFAYALHEIYWKTISVGRDFMSYKQELRDVALQNQLEVEELIVALTNKIYGEESND